VLDVGDERNDNHWLPFTLSPLGRGPG